MIVVWKQLANSAMKKDSLEGCMALRKKDLIATEKYNGMIGWQMERKHHRINVIDHEVAPKRGVEVQRINANQNLDLVQGQKTGVGHDHIPGQAPKSEL